MAVFNKLSLGAMQTNRDEKLRLFAGVLLNAGSHSAIPDRVQLIFADMVVRYEPEHLQYLSFLSDPDRWLPEHGYSPGITMELGVLMTATIFAGVEDWEIAFDTMVRELEADGIIASGFAPSVFVGDVVYSEHRLIWDKGTRFLEYVSGDLT